MKINKSVIVQTAFELLQESGIHKLSIRNVADRLNIKGASLYWHIKNKNELLGLIADEICKKIENPDEHLSSEEQIMSICRKFREILLAVRDSAHVLVETLPTTPHRIRLIQKICSLLEQFGMKREDIFSASWMINNYVTSFVIEEYRFKEAAAYDHTAPVLDELPFDMFKIDMEKEFQFGIEVLLEGLKSKSNSSFDH